MTTNHTEDIVELGVEIATQANQLAAERHWLLTTGLNPEVVNADHPLSSADEDMLVLYLAGLGDASAWGRGDFALYVRTKTRKLAKAQGWSRQRYNEVWGAEVTRIAKLFGVQVKTLFNNITTCERWPIADRLIGQHVRYKHHEAIPAYGDRQHWIAMLVKAEEQGWTWTKLYAVIQGHADPEGVQLNTGYQPVNAVPADADADAHIAANGHDRAEDASDASDDLQDELPFDAPPEDEEVETDDTPLFSDALDSVPSVQTYSIMLTDPRGATDVMVLDGASKYVVSFQFKNGTTYHVTPDAITGDISVVRVRN